MYAKTAESDAVMAVGRYGFAVIGYIGDPQGVEVTSPNLLVQNFPNPFNVYPNPFNVVRTRRELVDTLEPVLVPAGKRVLPLNKLVA